MAARRPTPDAYDENGAGGITTLAVTIGSQTTDYTLTADNSGFFGKQFASTTINYVAASGPVAFSSMR
jgi:hypothetical protein